MLQCDYHGRFSKYLCDVTLSFFSWLLHFSFCSLVDGHLGYFYIITIVSIVAVNMGVHVHPLDIMVLFSLDIYTEMGLLGHIVLFLDCCRQHRGDLYANKSFTFCGDSTDTLWCS